MRNKESLIYLPLAWQKKHAIGGIAYIFGGDDEKLTQVVWTPTPTIKGTYIITPDYLQGNKPVQFFGKEDTETSQYKLGQRAGLRKFPALRKKATGEIG